MVLIRAGLPLSYIATIIWAWTICPLSLQGARGAAKETETTGVYFFKKQYKPQSLPTYEALREQLPDPVYDDRPLWVEIYWKAWQLAFRNFHEPTPQSGFVSQFIDAAFNENIFLWDSCFMTMFCNFAHPLVPGISTLDNFYAKQQEDGEICREIVRVTGAPFPPWVNRERRPLFSRWGWPEYDEPGNIERNSPVLYRKRTIPFPPPRFTLDALNHPILAWAELESYRVSGDANRLSQIWEPLVQYYGALQKYLLQGNGLYMTDWASMDNSPRNRYLQGGGTGVDISSEMVLFARHLSQIATILGKGSEAVRFTREADSLASLMNRLMWDPKLLFYYDLTGEGKHAPIKTVAAFWTLLAKVASPAQASALVDELQNPSTFGRLNRIPTLAADQPGYDPAGGYWRGAVWAPTETMVIRGLENYGYSDLARENALQHLDLVSQVYKKTGTIWENYAPDTLGQGKPARGDFVGWSGIGPIMYLLEYAIGLKPNAQRNELMWELAPGGRRGCERFCFNGHIVSLLATAEIGGPHRIRITVDSDGDFSLRAGSKGSQKTFSVAKGKQEFVLELGPQN